MLRFTELLKLYGFIMRFGNGNALPATKVTMRKWVYIPFTSTCSNIQINKSVFSVFNSQYYYKALSIEVFAANLFGRN